MKLLYRYAHLYIQKRHSRSSIIQYRKRRTLLKDYNVQPSSSNENVYAKLLSPIQDIVPINPQKTSITIDILGEETYPKLSEWRKQNLIRRARRVLPLPISLTTDDKLGTYWKQRIVKSLFDKQQKLKKMNDPLNDVPSFVNFMAEENLDLLKKEFPDIYLKFQKLMTYKGKFDSEDFEDVKTHILQPYFPFLKSISGLENQNDFNKNLPNEYFDNNNKILDEDYENYLKHHELLQYMASNLNTINPKQYEPEIQGWTSQFWLRNYGKPDPSVPPSKVPCGGCGAHLHCVASNIPGFIPAQKFTLFSEKELHSQFCQRCEFLKKYNVALNVTVSTDEYPNLISKIQAKKSLVIILVDLLDFPCSVWPGIINLIGEKHQIYIVGNKVDLLPKDDKLYLERIKKSLKESLKFCNVSRNTKVRDISLISAKTGYGVENLITKLLRDMNNDQKDIFLIGCTNSGKSTLFNVLMQSDLCSLRDSDLMTRATTSIWPGTTLNLLKFPLNKLKGWQLELRLKRLNMSEKQDIAERRLKWTMHRQSNDNHYALLSERIGSTFRSNIPINYENDHPFAKVSQSAKPFDPRDPRFRNCNFLHDTPGVIYKDQLLNLLTTEELLRTIPREIITPRTYTLRPNQSLFIGGLARIDLTQARQHVWITVFASHYLPVNIVFTEQARKFYEMYLGTGMLAVPFGDEDRLNQWPKLVPKEMALNCIGWEESCADVVLSSAGWISVTGGEDTKCILRAFTPAGRGIYVRDPPMLPYAVRLRGKRILNTPCFENKCFTIDDYTKGAIPKRFSKYKEVDHIGQERIKKAIRFLKGNH